MSEDPWTPKLLPFETHPLGALRVARALITDEEHWTRSAPARRYRPPNKSEAGEWEPTHATDPLARRWCAAGALCAVTGKRKGPPGVHFLQAASIQLFRTDIGRANDDRVYSHADMLRCYDRAIALCAEAEGLDPR